jgi:hypothetical protein
MYKILNFLFGWDYIYWSNSCDQGIARVFISKDKRVCYFRYKGTSLIDVITRKEQVIWLTCKPERFFTDNWTTNTKLREQLKEC